MNKYFGIRYYSPTPFTLSRTLVAATFEKEIHQNGSIHAERCFFNSHSRWSLQFM